MLSLKFIRENVDLIKENNKNRLVDVDVDRLLELDSERLSNLKEVENLRSIRNSKSKTKPTPEIIKKMKEAGEKIKVYEEKIRNLDVEIRKLLLNIPNLTHKDVVISDDEDDNPVLEEAEIPKFDFIPKDHVELSETLDLIDFERGAKVAGSKFYYFKKDLAILELALSQYAMEIMLKKGFIPFITPDVAKNEMLENIGFIPRGENTQVYNLENTDLSLIGTSEITMCAYHADEILNEKDLPLKYAGLSHCFRTEAGSYSKYSKGIFRVHQFSKVEMFVYSKKEDAENIHKELLEIEKEIFNSLDIPFRVIDHCTADLGGPSIRTFDLEAWMPGKPNKEGSMGDWGEITSTSNCTDYQARSANIKYRKEDGTSEFVYTLNGTGISICRAIIALIENNQTKEGEIKIPEVLQKWMGKSIIKH
ncbi:serine--tRNA ligase [Patescibacteria group bacterium]|nr:serine--tRNA ligase [Patescibacteria group bacterium]